MVNRLKRRDRYTSRIFAFTEGLSGCRLREVCEDMMRTIIDTPKGRVCILLFFYPSKVRVTLFHEVETLMNRLSEITEQLQKLARQYPVDVVFEIDKTGYSTMSTEYNFSRKDPDGDQELVSFCRMVFEEIPRRLNEALTLKHSSRNAMEPYV